MSTRRAKGRDVRGVLLLDKPRGMTSNHVLQRTKRLYQAAKAGHTGSLDPLATGMLPICFGAATSLCAYLLDARKTYRVTVLFGIATDTADADGEVVQRVDTAPADRARVQSVLTRFVGDIDQVPPMYSALKQDGVRLYKLARSGVTVARQARRVSIESLELAELSWPEVTLTVRCSKGTYVRSLVEDVAAALGTVGHVRELRRLQVDPFSGESMITLEALEDFAAAGGLAALDERLLAIDAALPHWPAVHLGSENAARLTHGQAVGAAPEWGQGRVKVYAAGDLLALGEVTADGRLVPSRVFAP